MKLCPNCHRISKDDDFCSHCGSAVYGSYEDYDLDCDNIKGHSHEKISFAESDIRKGNIPDYETAEKIKAAREMLNNSRAEQERASRNVKNNAKKTGGAGCVVFLVIIFIIIPLMDVLVPLIKQLIELFNEI